MAGFYAYWTDPSVWEVLSIRRALLVCRECFFPFTVKEYAASKINRVDQDISFIEHFFGTGTLILRISGEDQDVVLKGVRHPKKTKEMLEKWARMEKNRIKKIICKR